MSWTTDDNENLRRVADALERQYMLDEYRLLLERAKTTPGRAHRIGELVEALWPETE